MRNTLISGIIATCLTIVPAFAAPKFSVSQLPNLAEPAEGGGLKGQLIDMLHLMETARNDSIEVEILPTIRSLQYIAEGQNDVHMPMIDPHNGAIETPGVMFSQAAIGYVTFMIFHKDDVSIDVDNLDGLTFETLGQTATFFDFDVNGTECMPCSMKKVVAGRIDGLVTSEGVGNRILAQEGIENMIATPLKVFPVRFIVRDGDTETDQWLSSVIAELRPTEEFRNTVSHFKQRD